MSATDLGDTARAGKHGSALIRTDVRDPDQVFDLALAITRCGPRRVVRVTYGETRALALLAIRTAPVFTRAVELVRISDSGGDKAATRQALADLISLTREMMEVS